MFAYPLCATCGAETVDSRCLVCDPDTRPRKILTPDFSRPRHLPDWTIHAEPLTHTPAWMNADEGYSTLVVPRPKPAGYYELPNRPSADSAWPVDKGHLRCGRAERRIIAAIERRSQFNDLAAEIGRFGLRAA